MMTTKQYLLGACCLAFLVLAGCSSAPRDMRLSNEAFEAIEADNYTRAEPLLQEALQLNPDNSYAHLNLGLVYHKTDRAELAREHYNRVVSLNSGDKAERVLFARNRQRTLADIARDNLRMLDAP